MQPKYRRLLFHGTTLGLTIVDAYLGRLVIPILYPGNHDYEVAMYAAFLITVALNELAIIREERQRLHNLIREMGGRSNESALRAVDELRDLGYLTDGTLRRKNFNIANLRNANLGHANLKEVKLMFTHLEGANLFVANLEGANLRCTHLEDAYLENANFLDANFVETKFSTKTILPDGSRWNPDVDMGKFTNPNKKN